MGGLGTGSVLAALVWVSIVSPDPTIVVVRWMLLGLLVSAVLSAVATDRVALPQSRRQVPIAVFMNGVNRGALQFGVELGSGVRTYVTSLAPYWAATVAVLVGLDTSPAIPILAGVLFAWGRVATVLIGLTATALGRHPVAWWETSGPWVSVVATAVSFGIVLKVLWT